MLELAKEWPPEVFETIGVIGFLLYVCAYSLLTFGKLTSSQATYFAMNWCAATCVLIGLFHSFNLASALIQMFWIAVSTVAIIIRLRGKGSNGAQPA